jgi:hypothetical protein
MKILCVEDGSVDLEELSNLKDGAILVYRQGSTPPKVIEISKKDNYQEQVFVLENKITAMANSVRTLVRDAIEHIKDKEIKKQVLIDFYDIMKTYGMRFL